MCLKTTDENMKLQSKLLLINDIIRDDKKFHAALYKFIYKTYCTLQCAIHNTPLQQHFVSKNCWKTFPSGPFLPGKLFWASTQQINMSGSFVFSYTNNVSDNVYFHGFERFFS